MASLGGNSTTGVDNRDNGGSRGYGNSGMSSRESAARGYDSQNNIDNQNEDQRLPQRVNNQSKPATPKPPQYDFTADIDSMFDPNAATSIADALLQQQYSSAILPFQREMQRGLITPEAFRLAEGNLNQQRSGLADTYKATALGELAKGKLGVQEALAKYKENPTSLEVGEGLDFNTALNNALKGQVDTFMTGFNDSFYGTHGQQNPFSFIPAQQASLGGRGTTSTSNPIALALANRDSQQSQRRLGDRVV